MSHAHSSPSLALPPLVLLLVLFVLPCDAGQVFGVAIAGKALSGSPAALVEEGTVLGPLAEAARLAGASAVWSPTHASVTVTSAEGKRILLSAGKTQMLVDGKEVELRKAPQVQSGVLVGPLSPLLQALGLRVHWTPGKSYMTANGLVKSVIVRAGAAGARIEVATSVPVTGSLVSASSPPKRYVDLPGVELEVAAGETRPIYTGPLVRMRTGQPGDKPNCARIVADLKASTPARWIPARDGHGGCLLLGSDDGHLAVVTQNLPKLTEVSSVQPGPDAERLRLTVNWPIMPQYDVAIRPPRIEVVLPEVECRLPSGLLRTYGDFVDQVEVRPQTSPRQTTVTLYLKELIRFDVLPMPFGGAEVVFRRGRLQDQTVALDPGHGGKDTGARGLKVLEKEVNLDVASRAARMLQAMGARAFLTREDDTYLGLYDRPEIAQRGNADLFVSVHCNAMPQRNCGHGTETYYYRPDSKGLGFLVQNALTENLGRTDRGVKSARFVVIREAKVPAVLAELMFINDDQEEALLQQTGVRDRAAGAIVEGVRQFVEGSGRASLALN